ncbi:hypothetical protein HPB48_015258 [Haemaphysalis longicornis]|uniref:RING-type domain-containing protein n=1 Tax=Haemaphysalis longicornis TaxID=44386 RepID=A0A9J6FRY4_HAELO|nr:hypothetical protein HPB48_015258 [Haemaphysalis longicornis]
MRWPCSVQPQRLIDALISQAKQRAVSAYAALRLCTPFNMAHWRQQFALVGYSADLEKRPLKFVDPIPASRICSACGNLPRLTYTLMCGHAFCEPCYESCATTSECVCPLDGDVCDRDDVTRKEYRAEQLLRRKVHCWNEVNGCGVVLPASQIAEHVLQDCQHHGTRCPNCSAVVLSHNICAHLKSRCTTCVLHAAAEARQGTDNNENSHLAASEREVKERTRQLDSRLAQLSLDSGLQQDKLAEIWHNINHLHETLKGKLGPASVQTLNRLEETEAAVKAILALEKTREARVGELDSKLSQLSLKSDCLSDKLTEICLVSNDLKGALTEQFRRALDSNVAAIKCLYTEKSELLRTTITSALSSIRSDRETHHQVIRGYAALKAKAVKNGWSRSKSDKVYLRRYLMSWGIRFQKEGDAVYVALLIQLHEGREDDFVDWPFTKELTLYAIHPVTRQERHVCGKPGTEGAKRKWYCRPVGGSNSAVYLLQRGLNQATLNVRVMSRKISCC